MSLPGGDADADAGPPPPPPPPPPPQPPPPPHDLPSLLARFFAPSYAKGRFSPSRLDTFVHTLSAQGVLHIVAAGCDDAVIAATRESWDPATHELRDHWKSLSWRVAVERVDLSGLHATQYYRYTPLPPALALSHDAALALAVLARIFIVAMPRFDNRRGDERDCVKIASGIADVVYRATTFVAPAVNASRTLALLQIPVDELNRIGGRTFQAILDPIVSCQVLGNERHLVSLPWELVCLRAIQNGVLNLRVLRAIVYIEYVLQRNAPITNETLHNHEAYDVLVENADIVLYTIGVEKYAIDFCVFRLCAILEGASTDTMPLVDQLHSCDLGPKSIYDSEAAHRSTTYKTREQPQRAAVAAQGTSAAPASSSTANFAQRPAGDPLGGVGGGAAAAGTGLAFATTAAGAARAQPPRVYDAPNEEIPWNHAVYEVQTRQTQMKALRKAPSRPSRSGRAAADTRTTQGADWASTLYQHQQQHGVAGGAGVGTRPPFRTPPPRCCAGKLRLGPPAMQTLGLDKDVASTVPSTIEGQRFLLRVGKGKLLVRTRKTMQSSYIETWLKRMSGVRVIETDRMTSYQEESEWHGALISEVLRGLFGSEASRWLLSHIWRGTVKISSESQTRCYCPHTTDASGYKIRALIPFDVVRTNKFFYCPELDKVFWLPREGDDPREVIVSRRGSIFFRECNHLPNNMVPCSVDSSRRVG